MGYRLEISKLKYIACGGKLYGYYGDTANDLKDLKSWNWLKDHRHIKGNEFWDNSFNPKIILNSKEIKEFITLYNEDYRKAQGRRKVKQDAFFDGELSEIEKAIKEDDAFLLEWF